jgi:hypothetical protein
VEQPQAEVPEGMEDGHDRHARQQQLILDIGIGSQAAEP